MFLLYCMTNAAPATLPPGPGGAEVKPLVNGPIAVWYSGYASAAAQADLLAFHGVLIALFKERAVIPFRFPTVMPDEKAIADWLSRHSLLVARELSRLEGKVQMELHFSATTAGTGTSGRGYLEGKRDAARALEEEAAKARAAVAHVVNDWRQKETRDGLRCYALVARGDESHFRTQLGTIRGGARLSGPWPPSEFLDPALTTFA